MTCNLSSGVLCSTWLSPPKRSSFGVLPKLSLHSSPVSCGFWVKWLLLQKRFCGGFRQLFFTFVSQSPCGVKVAWIADMSHQYTSSPQKTTHHVVAIGVFFGLLVVVVVVVGCLLVGCWFLLVVLLLLLWRWRIRRQAPLVRDVSSKNIDLFLTCLLQLCHARSAFRCDWWINSCFWKGGLCRCLSEDSEGVKTGLGAKAWRPTLPTTAPSRQLPTGWRSNLDRRSDLDPSSCTACDPGVSATWQGARSGHHGGMWGKWW